MNKYIDIKIIDETKPVLIVGDVHNCLLELINLCHKAKKDFPTARVILAGDIVDKGAYKEETTAYCRHMGFDAVMGNHDEKILRAHRGNPVTMTDNFKETLDALSDKDIAWLDALPHCIRLPHYNSLIVHGGLYPDIPLEEQPFKKVIRLRRYNPETLKLYKPDEEEGVKWADEWKGPEFVFYGHHAMEEIYEGDYTLGLDTGCVYGGKLSGVVIFKDEEGKNDIKLYQVPAYKTWWHKHNRPRK